MHALMMMTLGAVRTNCRSDQAGSGSLSLDQIIITTTQEFYRVRQQQRSLISISVGHLATADMNKQPVINYCVNTAISLNE